jgi:hypothetical protein
MFQSLINKRKLSLTLALVAAVFVFAGSNQANIISEVKKEVVATSINKALNFNSLSCMIGDGD